MVIDQERREANRSYNYIRALVATLKEDTEDHPRDPVYFSYNNRIVKQITWGYGERIKKFGNGSLAIDVRTLKNEPIELKNAEVFNLIPLGRIRQRINSKGLKEDCFEKVEVVEKLYTRLQRMIKRNQERWSVEDGIR